MLLNISPDELERLGAGDLRHADDGLHCRGDGTGLGDAPRWPRSRPRGRLGGRGRSHRRRRRGPPVERERDGGREAAAEGMIGGEKGGSVEAARGDGRRHRWENGEGLRWRGGERVDKRTGNGAFLGFEKGFGEGNPIVVRGRIGIQIRTI